MDHPTPGFLGSTIWQEGDFAKREEVLDGRHHSRHASATAVCHQQVQPVLDRPRAARELALAVLANEDLNSVPILAAAKGRGWLASNVPPLEKELRQGALRTEKGVLVA